MAGPCPPSNRVAAGRLITRRIDATICSGSESGQIGSANRAANNQVASDQRSLLGQIIGHMPRRVTRGMHHDDLQRPDLQLLVVGYVRVRFERWNDKR